MEKARRYENDFFNGATQKPRMKLPNADQAIVPPEKSHIIYSQLLIVTGNTKLRSFAVLDSNWNLGKSLPMLC